MLGPGLLFFSIIPLFFLKYYDVVVMAPKDVHVLMLQTCKHVTLNSKHKVADVIKDKGLQMETLA